MTLRANITMTAAALLALALCAGCANVPLTENGLVVGKDTTASIDDVGVARVTRGF